MTTVPPIEPLVPNPPREPVEARVAVLRAEQEAASDRRIKAALQYEVGLVFERGLHQEAQAVREYLGAYNLDATFHPPLVALVRIFERRRSFKNLARLYETEAKSAATDANKASSFVDRGALAQDREDDLSAARASFEQALSVDAESAIAALSLEQLILSAGDHAALPGVLAARAATAHDPVLKSLLLGELARAHELAGDSDSALEAARAAAQQPAAQMRAAERLERLGRRLGSVSDVVTALETRAMAAGRFARGEGDEPEGSGAFSVQRFTDEAKAGVEGAALWREAARLRLLHLGDAPGASAALGEAVRLRPEDLSLRRDRMLSSELAGNLALAAAEAAHILEQGIEGRHAAPLHFRIAEDAQSRGDVMGAREALAAACAADPESAVAAAMLEDLSLASGWIDEWVDRLAAAANAAEGEARARLAWRAAHLTITRLSDLARARPLYELAVESTAEPAAPLRELLGASLRHGDAASARKAARALLEQPIDDEERSAVLRDLHELERVVLEDDEGARAVMAQALDTPSAGWAPELARIHAASAGDYPLLARAHQLLADRESDPEAAAAHLCAAARALTRAADHDSAAGVLEKARALVPGHRYAVALLEEIHRARGDADAVVKLLREAAEADRSARANDTRLLLAGAAAEAAGDMSLAISTYEEAADRDPTAMGPLFALRRVAEARGDDALRLRALERISELEISAGMASRATLDLAEHYHVIAGQAPLAETPLRAALSSSEVSLPAALGLALLGHVAPSATVDGLRALSAAAPEELRPAFSLEEAGSLLDVVNDASAASAVLDVTLEAEPNSRVARLEKLRTCFHGASGVGSSADEAWRQARATAWLELASACEDSASGAGLVLHALRAATFAGVDNTDAVLSASVLPDLAPDSLAGFFASYEALGEYDDPSERADALGRVASVASGSGASAMRAQWARALVAAERSDEALEILLELVAADDDDLSSWEMIRVAAREAAQWGDLARAADRLAAAVRTDEGPSELLATLLEESAAIRMDYLEDAGAEERLREALSIDPLRPVAYWRLHDLLAERGDDEGVLALVTARISVTDDPDTLSPLFYEQARLRRSLGQREEALLSLDNLLMLEPEHLGGLALLVEINVQRESFREAVDALRTLATAADVPASQRRIARLGAADFLEKRLDDPEGALEELRAIEALGLADFGLHVRIADIASRANLLEVESAALLNAANATTDPQELALIQKRRGRLLDERLGDEEAATLAYTRALYAVPTDVEAASALAVLLDTAGRLDLSHRFEGSIRELLASAPTDPDLLRALRLAARFRVDKALEASVLGALAAMGLASAEESEELAEDTEVMTRLRATQQPFDDADVAAIRFPGDTGAVLELAAEVHETLVEMDKLDLSRFGLARGDLVSAKSPTPLMSELQGYVALFGAPAFELYCGGDDAQRLTVMPLFKGKPTWVAGRDVRTPFDIARRYEIGRLSLALRLGVGHLALRTPDATATALFAIAAAAGAPLPAGEGRAGMAEATRAAQKAIGRRVRRAIPPILERIGDGGRPILAWSQALHQSLRRAGLVAAGDLAAVLALLGFPANRESIEQSATALDLLRFWTSPPVIEARRRRGLAS